MPSSPPFALINTIAWRRFLLTVWPWRGLAYAITTAIAAGFLVTVLSCPLAPIFVAGGQIVHENGHPLLTAIIGIIGLVVFAIGGPPLAVGVGHVERRRLKLVDDRATRDGRRGNMYLDPATWRAFAYMILLAVLAPLWTGALILATFIVVALILAPLVVSQSGPIVIVRATVHSTGAAWLVTILGVALLPVLFYLISAFAAAQGALARMLLSAEPNPAQAQLVEVARSRARLADAFDAERHRIERDLHDGAQQRLVALTMQLSLAKLDLPEQSPAATAVASAHEHAKALMVELRDLIHGINPRTLTELGLPAALQELAGATVVPTTVSGDLGRLSPSTETVAYFAAAEALTNIAKHADASHATVTLERNRTVLTVEVTDYGRGGAEPAAGSGLTGLADRIAAAGGRMLLSSPAGGPTVVRIELPCES